jgi:hypothetical protein
MLPVLVRRSALLLGSVLTLAACGTDTATDVRKSVTGTYALESVNGQPLPFTEDASAPGTQLTASELVARSDGTFEQSFSRQTGSALATTTVAGTYSVGDQVVAFTYAGNVMPSSLGSLTPGGGLSMTVNGASFRYRRN